jgi:hypothetical protein
VAPFKVYEHTFTLLNVGNSPLTLTQIGERSENFEIDLGGGSVLPGETKRIVAKWTAAPSDDAFHGKALIATNDPTNPIIKLEARGHTKLLLAADPPSLSVSRILPHESSLVETKLVSEFWKSFEIADIRCTLPHVTWKLSPLDKNELGSETSVSGWRLSVTLPPGLPEGPLSELMTIVAKPTGEATTESLESAENSPVERTIALAGQVIRRLSVHGPDIDVTGTISAGTVDSERGYTGMFTVRVNDAEPELPLVDTYTTPSFVEVLWQPYGDKAVAGLYRLQVRVPPQATPAVFQGPTKGKVKLVFAHPRISELDLGIEFVVMKSRSTRKLQTASMGNKSGP